MRLAILEPLWAPSSGAAGVEVVRFSGSCGATRIYVSRACVGTPM